MSRRTMLHALGRDGIVPDDRVDGFFKNVFSVELTDEMHFELSTYDKILTIFDDNETVLHRLERVDEVVVLNEDWNEESQEEE